jgi:hypothetical protein
LWQLAHLDEPVVLNNTAALLWPARTAWTPDILAERLINLTGVKVMTKRPQGWGPLYQGCLAPCHHTPSSRRPGCPGGFVAGATPFFYYHGSPMTEEASLVQDYARQTYRRANITAKDFFDHWNSRYGMGLE